MRIFLRNHLYFLDPCTQDQQWRTTALLSFRIIAFLRNRNHPFSVIVIFYVIFFLFKIVFIFYTLSPFRPVHIGPIVENLSPVVEQLEETGTSFYNLFTMGRVAQYLTGETKESNPVSQFVQGEKNRQKTSLTTGGNRHDLLQPLHRGEGCSVPHGEDQGEQPRVAVCPRCVFHQKKRQETSIRCFDFLKILTMSRIIRVIIQFFAPKQRQRGG